MSTRFINIRKIIFGKPAFWLVFSLILLILSPLPMSVFPGLRPFIMGVLLTLVVITGLASIYHSFYRYAIGMVLGIFTVILVVLSLWFENIYWLNLARTIALLCLAAYIGRNLFDLVYLSKKVNKNIIYTAVAGYLLIGVIGGQASYLLEMIKMGSYTHTGDYILYDFQYFSFVTLTTLGYGDITPVSPQAKAITLFISLMGQLYLTIIIAILVGKYIARSEKR